MAVCPGQLYGHCELVGGLFKCGTALGLTALATAMQGDRAILQLQFKTWCDA